jgi:AcrR family transcriptional regulator
MPRIKEATVAEHRKAQRAALLAAARHIVAELGPGALTFAELADRTGLARPSVYEYFRSKGELAVALIDEEFPQWHAAIHAALERAKGPERKIDAFVRTMLGLVAAGRHHVPFALLAVDFDEATRAHVVGHHAHLLRALRAPLAELGVADLDGCLRLLDGVIVAAIESLRGGSEPEGTVDSAATFLLGGVLALRDGAGRRPKRARLKGGKAAPEEPAVRPKRGLRAKTD